MTNVATIHSLAVSEQELISVLESSLYPGARPESIKMVIAYCKTAQLDPMLKPVHIVPMRVKQRRRDGRDWEYVWRDVIMPGIEFYRIRAARTGEYVGMDKAEWGPEITETLGGVKVTYPEWCEVTVYRLVGGQRCPFPSGRVRWKETYATRGYDEDGKKSEAPNSMWEKRSYGQLEKCAEALALRRAFPELGAQPTAEEMEGKVIEMDVTPPVVAGPKARSETQSHAENGDHGASNGAPAEDEAKPKATPLRPSQSSIIKKRLESAGLTELDLEVAFPGKCIEPKAGKTLFLSTEANMILEWISANAKV